MFAKVAKIGGQVREVFLSDGAATVGQALDAAGETGEGFELRLKNETVDRDASIGDGEVLALVPKTGIKGGL